MTYSSRRLNITLLVMKKYKAIIVGAGPAGMGMAMALDKLGLDKEDFIILERDKVGSTFYKWPSEMRFITPSFIGNQFGAVDLNAISHDTSPAFTINKEHLSGDEYAEYLQAIADNFEPPIKTGVEVESVKKTADEFELTTNKGRFWADFLIWCTGEFQFPNLSVFSGSENCLHNSKIEAYSKVEGDEQLIIGGYESGIDAAVNFSKLGKKVTVLDGSDRWNEFSSDPSTILSTYTYERLENELSKGNIELVSNFKVAEVKEKNGEYEVISENGESFNSEQKPILCTGFSGGMRPIETLIEEDQNGNIALTEKDESVTTKNLFISGPMVRQGNVIFCFVYKFRQRFPVIAKEIGERLDIDTESLEVYRKANMFLDDLSCCNLECAC